MTLKTNAKELKLYSLAREYKLKNIKDSINKARKLSRNEILNSKDIDWLDFAREKNKHEKVEFSVTYNPALPDIDKILHSLKPVLDSSERCISGQKFTNHTITKVKPLMMLLTKASICRCSSTMKSYDISLSINYKTKNVCYLVTCKDQYVGETKRQLNHHMNGHKSDIKLKKKVF